MLHLPLIEMRCTHCNGIQQIKNRNQSEYVTRCVHCKSLILVEIQKREKPNNVLFTLVVSVIQKAEGKEETKEPPINLSEVA